MLEFVLGRAGTGKTTLLREKAALSREQVILLVPEQYTFETERALLEKYGTETANHVKVYSFTRLAEAAFLRYGGNAGKRLTDGGRRILMTLAVEACADRLTLFKKSAVSGRMTDTSSSRGSSMRKESSCTSASGSPSSGLKGSSAPQEYSSSWPSMA